MTNRLENKIAVVTGATSGIGLATAKLFAALQGTLNQSTRNSYIGRVARGHGIRGTVERFRQIITQVAAKIFNKCRHQIPLLSQETLFGYRV